MGQKDRQGRTRCYHMKICAHRFCATHTKKTGAHREQEFERNDRPSPEPPRPKECDHARSPFMINPRTQGGCVRERVGFQKVSCQQALSNERNLMPNVDVYEVVRDQCQEKSRQRSVSHPAQHYHFPALTSELARARIDGVYVRHRAQKSTPGPAETRAGSFVVSYRI